LEIQIDQHFAPSRSKRVTTEDAIVTQGIGCFLTGPVSYKATDQIGMLE